MAHPTQVQASLEQLAEMEFVHLETAVDASARAAAGTVRGYSEWMTTAKPAASLGWDWTMSLQTREISVQTLSLRTNIQVRDPHGDKLDRTTNGTALGLLISTLPWEKEVGRAVSSLHVAH